MANSMLTAVDQVRAFRAFRALSLLGMLLCLLLTGAHFGRAALPGCSGTLFDCHDTVGSLSGIGGIPLSVIGLVGYSGLFVLCVLVLKRKFHTERAACLALGFSIVAVLLSLALFAFSVFVRHLCPYCVLLYVTNVALLVVSCWSSRAKVTVWLSGARLSGVLGFVSVVCAVSLAGNVLIGYRLYRHELLAFVAAALEPAPVGNADHSRGDPRSGVTVLVYSDPQCPACRQLEQSLNTLFREEKFYWVLRIFPLASHPRSYVYAQACEAAASQGRFWEFVDSLYARPPRSDSLEALLGRAQLLRLNVAEFAKAVRSGAERLKVDEAIRAGHDVMIYVTPTLFINGQRFNGAPTLDALRILVRQAAEKRPK